MQLRRIKFILFILISVPCFGKEYGVRFANFDVPQEHRTGINLNPKNNFTFKKDFELSYDIQKYKHFYSDFGFVSRIIINNELNVDLLLQQEEKSKVNLNVVIGSYVVHSQEVQFEKLFLEWMKVSFYFDKKNECIVFSFDDQVKEIPFEYETNTTKVNAEFGRIIDGKYSTSKVPAIAVKDIQIKSNNKLQYHWPLDEMRGDKAYDIKKTHEILLQNPIWIPPLHLKWSKISRHIPGNIQVVFDQENELIFIVTSEKLISLSAQTNQFNEIKYKTPFKLDSSVFSKDYCLFDKLSNTIFCYNASLKEVDYFDFNAKEWVSDFSKKSDEIIGYEQHNKFMCPLDSTIYIFGGYGNYQFQNAVQRYNRKNQTWDLLEPKGSLFYPRYLSALGSNDTGDTVYILGGYGSVTGDQKENPHYYSELYQFTPEDSSFKHLFKLNAVNFDKCFANSMVIDNNTYYALSFSKEKFITQFQLIRGSLTDSSFVKVGFPNSFTFYDTRSYIDMFYAPKQKKLFVISFYKPHNNKDTQLDIFSTNYPPNQFYEELPRINKSYPFTSGLYIAIGVLMFGLSLIFILKKKKKVIPSIKQYQIPDKPLVKILLFDKFKMTDKDGINLAKNFSPQLKEIFILILLSSIDYDRGVSNRMLSEAIWNEPEYKNIRKKISVAISLLKNLINKIEGIELHNDDGDWTIEMNTEKIYCDYHHFNALQQSPINKESISQLLHIVKRGKLLFEMERLWLDDYKSNVSHNIVDILVPELDKLDLYKQADFAIEIADVILKYDSLNEEAMSYKCKVLKSLGKHIMAKECFDTFCNEYRILYNENFNKEFGDTL